jgi:hypothetical protein
MSIELRAGAVTARFDPDAGELHTVAVAGQIVLLRLYGAVRDENWGTVPADIRVTEQRVDADRFHIAFTAVHRRAPMDFSWRGTIGGDPDGTVTFTLDGVARADFRRNRIGFCLLHPADAAGARCTAERTDGTTQEAALPKAISPDQPVEPFAELRALTQHLPGGGAVRFVFDGDRFEMEDQRNWTDASFKTFCTPLRLPYPVALSAGDTVRQSVAVQPIAPALPIGLEFAGDAPDPTPAQLERLRALRPAHLRIDCVASGDWQERLARAGALAAALGCPLELAAIVDDGASSAFLKAVAALCPVAPVRLLVLPGRESVNARPDYARLAGIGREAFADTPLFLGSDADFLFVNRYPPPMDLCDGLTFALNPQVHAFDPISIRQTVSVYGALLATARDRARGKPVLVSPLTLLPRWNPYAATPADRTASPPADPRQAEPWVADWARDALFALAAGGAHAATVFETHGPRGVLATPLEAALQPRDKT